MSNQISKIKMSIIEKIKSVTSATEIRPQYITDAEIVKLVTLYLTRLDEAAHEFRSNHQFVCEATYSKDFDCVFIDLPKYLGRIVVKIDKDLLLELCLFNDALSSSNVKKWKMIEDQEFTGILEQFNAADDLKSFENILASSIKVITKVCSNGVFWFVQNNNGVLKITNNYVGKHFIVEHRHYSRGDTKQVVDYSE